MSHDYWQDNVITNDRTGKAAVRSRNVWGAAFYAHAPWPEKMCAQDYDVGSVARWLLDGTQTFRFDVENGHAVYEIVERCPYGGAYHGRLIESSYEEMCR